MILGATNNMSSISAFVGVERGLFLKHGLDVKVKVFITPATFKAFDDAVEMLLDQKKLRAKVTSQSYDDRFIKEAMREHPELFADLPRVP